uniref:Envelope glycoprotein M n=2 Tax=Zeugodacus cucurbitae TaxID=28588 RepID=A0A0A1XDY5_ZEUCU
MLILLAGILYFVIMAIKNTNSKRHIQEQQKNSTKGYRGLDHVFGLNYNEFQLQARGTADDLVRNWTATRGAVSDAPKNLCPPKEDITEVNKRVEDINNEFEVLCLGVLEWSEYMRFFYRNMTTCITQTDPGRKLLKTLDFRHFLVKTMQVEKLLDFYRVFSIVDKFFYSFSKLYNSTMDWPVNLESKTKNALSPYFLEITKNLGDKGNQFRSVSTQFDNEQRGDKDMHGANENKNDDKHKSKEPLCIFILDIICYTLLLLITAILLIALLRRCCGKRYRSEARCCNQENGSCLFQLAAFLMFLFLLLVLYPFLWHFVHGAGRYNSECTRDDTNKNERSIEFNEEDQCVDEQTFKKILDDHVDMKINFRLPDNRTAAELNLGTPELQKNAITFKQSARTSKNLDLTNLCEEIKNSTNPKHLTEIYTEMYRYANSDMPEGQWKELSLCNLQSFKTHRIDEYQSSVVFTSGILLATYCNRVVEFFKENYGKITGECLKGIEGVKDGLSKQDKLELSEIIAGLNEMYTKELDGYVDMATDRLVNQVGLCRKISDGSEQTTNCDVNIHLQNVSWSALLILIWLVLPLIPIALYLARLYGYGMSRSSHCSCQERGSKTAAAAPRAKDGRWNTNTLMGEMQRHLYKRFCEDSTTPGAANGQSCACKTGRTGHMQGPKRGKRCLDDGSANYAMKQQANALLLKGKAHTSKALGKANARKSRKAKEIKEQPAPTTSKGLAKVAQIERKKCDCCTNGPSSSMAKSAHRRPRKEIKNVGETLEEIVEERSVSGKNGLDINASIHIISFNQK